MVQFKFKEVRSWFLSVLTIQYVTCTCYFQIFDPVTKNVLCTGDKKVINEGHKSFPSGHTSCKQFNYFGSVSCFDLSPVSKAVYILKNLDY